MEVLQILFFAAIAVFLGYRLYTILGRPQGRSPEEHARDLREKQARAQQAQTSKPVDKTAASAPATPQPSFDDYEESAQDGLMAIAQADTRFDPVEFLKGARSAYGLIVKAYADGDMDTLKLLMSDRFVLA